MNEFFIQATYEWVFPLFSSQIQFLSICRVPLPWLYSIFFTDFRSLFFCFLNFSTFADNFSGLSLFVLWFSMLTIFNVDSSVSPGRWLWSRLPLSSRSESLRLRPGSSSCSCRPRQIPWWRSWAPPRRSGRFSRGATASSCWTSWSGATTSSRAWWTPAITSPSSGMTTVTSHGSSVYQSWSWRGARSQAQSGCPESPQWSGAASEWGDGSPLSSPRTHQ